MGYTTDFWGEIKIEPALNPTEVAYLKAFADTRRMHRARGPYFVGGTGPAGQNADEDVIDYNQPDPSQPGLWCQWVPTHDGSALGWDGGEKFYHPVDWMVYLIEHFLKPDALAFAALQRPKDFELFTFNHVCNGRIDAQGEDAVDRWALRVQDNVVTARHFIMIDPFAESAR